MIGSTNTDQGLAGVAALIVFIALVLVAAITAAVILDVTGSLEQQAAQTGQDATEQIASTLQIYDRTANIDGDGEVTNVQFVIGLAPGTPAVNLENVLITMTSNEQRYDLIAEGVDGDGGEFEIRSIKPEDGDNVVRGPEQRYELSIDADDGETPSFDRNQRVQVTFTSGPGGQAFQEFRIPSTIDETVGSISL